jgi:hypothetical protein
VDNDSGGRQKSGEAGGLGSVDAGVIYRVREYAREQETHREQMRKNKEVRKVQGGLMAKMTGCNVCSRSDRLPT